MANGFTHHYHFCEFSLIKRRFRCDFKILFHFFDEIPINKQNSQRWDAAFGGVSSLAINRAPCLNELME